MTREMVVYKSVWTQRHKKDQQSEIATTGLLSRISEVLRVFAGSALSECHFLASLLIELPFVFKKYNNSLHHSIKKTHFQAFKKSNEKEVYSNPKNNREIGKPNFKLGQLVRTVDIKKVFSRGDSTHYSYKLYTITEIILDRIPSYRIDYLTERCNENLLLPKILS